MNKLKRTLMPLMAVILTLALAVSFAACGAKSDDEDSSSTPSANIVETEPEFDNVDSFLQDETVAKQINSVLTENEDTNVTIKAENNSLVYEFIIPKENVTETTAKELEDGVASTATVFSNIADALKDAVKENNPSVIIRYLDSENNTLYEREFKPEAAE